MTVRGLVDWQSPNKPFPVLFPVMRDAMLGLVFWEGHVVDSSRERADGSLLLSLSEDHSYRPRCGRCESDCVLVHERRRRRARDRDWFDRRIWLDVPIRRLDCYHCGARAAERLNWLDAGERITHRLRAWVEVLLQILPIAHVAKLTGLHWHAVKRADRRRLQAQHGHFGARGPVSRHRPLRSGSGGPGAGRSGQRLAQSRHNTR